MQTLPSTMPRSAFRNNCQHFRQLDAIISMSSALVIALKTHANMYSIRLQLSCYALHPVWVHMQRAAKNQHSYYVLLYTCDMYGRYEGHRHALSVEILTFVALKPEDGRFRYLEPHLSASRLSDKGVRLMILSSFQNVFYRHASAKRVMLTEGLVWRSCNFCSL